jgi:hypothetical protein
LQQMNRSHDLRSRRRCFVTANTCQSGQRGLTVLAGDAHNIARKRWPAVRITALALRTATAAMVLRQAACHAEVNSARIYLGSAWPCIFRVALEGVAISAWADNVHVNRSVALGFLIAGLDRLVEFYTAVERPPNARSPMRVAEFTHLHKDVTSC